MDNQDVAQLNELLSMCGEEKSDYSVIDENVSTEVQSTRSSQWQSLPSNITTMKEKEEEKKKKKKRNTHRLILEKLWNTSNN